MSNMKIILCSFITFSVAAKSDPILDKMATLVECAQYFAQEFIPDRCFR